MLRFIDYLTLLESKVDDLEQQNPNIPVRQYATHDKTSTKKFLPWLVKQHKLGNVTPDHPDLDNTLSNFDKYKSKHGITDHTQHSFQELVNAVKPHIGTAATNKEKQKQEVDSGVEILHKEPNGITAQHIKTKEASQNLYGGGNERGGPKGGARGTSWCVSARSKDCLFKKVYGKMYTIHDPNDDHAPYAVHPEEGVMTNRHNDGDKPINDVLKEKPHLATAVDKIQDHWNANLSPEEKIIENLKFKVKNHYDDLDEKDISDVLKTNKYDIRESVIQHPKFNADHITQVLTHENNETDPYGLIRIAALKKSKLTTVDHINYVLTHENNETDPDGSVRALAIENPNCNADHITYILTHEDEKSDPNGNLRLGAINHFKVNENHIMQLLKHSNNETDPDGYLRRSAIWHRLFNENHIAHILKHENNTTDPSELVRDYTIRHEKVTKDQLTHVLTNKNNKFGTMIRRSALKHHNIESSHILQSLTHESNQTDPFFRVRADALYHPKLKMSQVDYMMKYRGEEDNPLYKNAKKRLELEELSKRT